MGKAHKAVMIINNLLIYIDQGSGPRHPQGTQRTTDHLPCPPCPALIQRLGSNPLITGSDLAALAICVRPAGIELSKHRGSLR